MKYTNITTDRKLAKFCAEAANEGEIAFDTEFVSEDTYLNHLCLIQVATDERIAVIDPFEIDDLAPFWNLLTESKKTVIAHAAREEFCFAFRSTSQSIPNLFDVQFAAGMVGMEYPAAYSTLVSKLCGKSLEKGETRTDWRRRPLSKHQIEYALQDVLHLHQIYEKLKKRLKKLKRIEWFEQDMDDWQHGLINTLTGEVWRRLSGVSKLSPRGLAAAREIWLWRDEVAAERNRPARRILRDDLVVELSKRATPDPNRIRSIRGMERRDTQQYIDEISRCIKRASKIPLKDCPNIERSRATAPSGMLTQFLSSALAVICRDAKISPQIVGTSSDIREWLAFRSSSGRKKKDADSLPALAKGWRRDIIGKQLEELLEGKVSLFVKNPKSDQPLAFKPKTID